MLVIIIWLKHEYYKENTEMLLVTSKEAGLEVSAIFRQHNLVQNHGMERDDMSFKKCDKGQAFWNDANKRKLHVRGNLNL
jgi:hypothetical protein